MDKGKTGAFRTLVRTAPVFFYRISVIWAISPFKCS